MDITPLALDPWIKALQEKEKNSWRGVSLQNMGFIGEGLFQKTVTGPNSKTLEKLKMCPQPENLLNFQPVSENQLIRTSLPSNIFSKGNVFNRKYLKYKIHKAEARLVRSILEVAGFSYTDSHDWTVMWLGCSAKLYLYEGLNSNQRINHFPNSYEITRKDRMCVNLMAMQRRYGPSEYGYFPETFIIPNEFNDFCLRYRNDKETKWIVKPSNSSQGRGIFILDNINMLRTSESCVVSRFVHNPLLINDLKFDLRIYVLVTSFEPLKIYVYDEGLARFASEKYSNFSKANKFSFLTNYSINKQNENYIQNEDAQSDNIGHKWSFSALIKYLKSSGVDTDLITMRIYDLIIKTIITAESTVVSFVRKYELSRNNCFDLFGFDILLDAQLRAWLLEVNLSPSLATESPLDLNIKSNLVSEVFNIIGMHGQPSRPATHSSARVKSKLTRPQTAKDGESSLKYKEMINECFAEFLRAKHFVRVYPVEGCQIYDKFFSVPRKINKVLYTALFSEVVNEDISPVVITGEDLLIEYLIRILAASQRIVLNKRWENAVQEFVNHEIWPAVGIRIPGNSYLTKLSGITAELKKRNAACGKNEENLLKVKIVAKFSPAEIENSLRGCKNEITELVSCFFRDGVGLLSQMQTTTVTQTPKHGYLNLKNLMGRTDSAQKKKYLRSTSHVLAAYRQKKASESMESFQTQYLPFY